MATFSFLEPYRQKIEYLIKENIQALDKKTPLRDACEYALLNGGKRFRPILVLLVAEALNNQIEVSHAALAVEYFHTASLVADDLPCMDNDDERRNKPSLHKVYGETTALLVSYALIAAGYQKLAENAKVVGNAHLPFSKNSDLICRMALENATHNTGLKGATGGQFFDIYPTNLDLSSAREVIDKKTVSLFEISFVFGWLFGGGNLDQLHLVKKAASHFGMAFQIADDIDDMEQDKINGRKINIANLCDKVTAEQMVREEWIQYQTTIDLLGLKSSYLNKITTDCVLLTN